MAYARGLEYELICKFRRFRTFRSTNKVSSEAKKYLEFCKTFESKQIIQSPTRVKHSTSSLIDHILTNIYQ